MHESLQMYTFLERKFCKKYNLGNNFFTQNHYPLCFLTFWVFADFVISCQIGSKIWNCVKKGFCFCCISAWNSKISKSSQNEKRQHLNWCFCQKAQCKSNFLNVWSFIAHFKRNITKKKKKNIWDVLNWLSAQVENSHTLNLCDQKKSYDVVRIVELLWPWWHQSE